MLAEDGQDLSDFYSSRAGDQISATTTVGRKQGKAGLALVVVGAILILGGVGAAFFGRGEEVAVENEQQLKDKTTNAPKPIPTPKRPTLSPTPGTEEPTAFPTEYPTAFPTEADEDATPAPTDGQLLSFLAELVGRDRLLDTQSVPHAAYTWLGNNLKLNEYDDVHLKQRFAMACLYYATNADGNWETDDGWLSDDDECTWYGANCENGFLITLNMTSNGLTGLVPNEITILKDFLLSLEMSDNDLVNTNEELAWMGELTKLSKCVRVGGYSIGVYGSQ